MQKFSAFINSLNNLKGNILLLYMTENMVMHASRCNIEQRNKEHYLNKFLNFVKS